ncbi:MAG: DUF4920 domain-containing protein [Myxococcales bacterium]|nr:DUF4920 domain-containing protein [Myxococcales bacterium]MCB9643210.1 DUF4920 domain-containing protein [Myxococcales bacterium]
MKLRQIFFLFAALAWLAPNAQAHEGHNHGNVKAKMIKQGKKLVKKYPWSARKDCSGSYGTPVQASVESVTLASLMKAPAKYKGRFVSVTAKIHDACQKKGCWMMLSEKGQFMRVRFKGYKFFVPTNSKGYIATVVGTARKAMLPAHIVKHYAEESGDKNALRKVYKPQQVIAFTAHFVTLKKASK